MDKNLHAALGAVLGAAATVFFYLVVLLPVGEISTNDRLDRAMTQYELQCEKDRHEYCAVVVQDIRERVGIPQK